MKVLVSSVFRPGTPIDRQQLFAGRLDQVNDVLNAALQPGRHVIMFGERGVGKTSLARVISEIIKASKGYRLLNCGTINCDKTDNFNTLWRKIFRELSFVRESSEVGFKGQAQQSDVPLETMLPNRELSSDDIRYMLAKIKDHTLIIIDELDRLTDRSARTQLADTIKNLSDHSVNSTVILVGVADSVEELISEHHSIERALVQVPMPRMSTKELTQIINNGLEAGSMTAEQSVTVWIAHLAQGLPHYAHSLGLYSAFKAIESNRTNVTADDVLDATKTTVQKSHTIHSELGYFPAAAVSVPMGKMMGRKYYVPNFSRHLFDLCELKRGPVLKKIGEPRRIRFRFADPMMQPFVIIHDYSNGNLTNALLEESKGRTRDALLGKLSS